MRIFAPLYNIVMRNRKYQIWLPLMFSLVLVGGMFIGYKLSRDRIGAKFFRNEHRSPMEEIIGLVNTEYVDPINMDSFQTQSISKILTGLDPHTTYITPAALQGINEDMAGAYQGLGLDYQMKGDTAVVVNLFADGPSAKAGLQKGDRLIAVNDHISLVGNNFTADSVRTHIKNVKDRKMTLTVVRNNHLRTFTVKKAVVPKPSVVAAYMLAPNTGYIKITRFTETTYPEFMIAMEKLKKSGLQQLVLDLRGNGGGVMQQAVDIVDEFLPDDRLVVYTQGSKTGRKDYKCKREGVFEKGKIAVLVDEETASASEIIAGALQDWDRAAMVGRRTFGKGLVQEQYNLSNGGALRLTIARYYTPLGRCIQKAYNNDTDDYARDLQKRLDNGELEHGDTTKNRGKMFITPGGKTVYDGGGITPDVFVGYDPTALTTPVLDLRIHGWLNEYALKCYEDRKSMFDTYKSPLELNAQYQPSEQEWNGLVQLAQSKNIDLANTDSKTKTLLLDDLKACIARVIWYPEGYYVIHNQKDTAVHAALNALGK
ncbi:MAG: S41 family peptidase [Chitinophagaceae bacterium]